MAGNDNRMGEILGHLGRAAGAAAGSVSDATKAASAKIGEKYNVLKLNLDINRMHSEQDKLFSEIGRALFMVKQGGDDAESTQQTVDDLLGQAEEKQREIDEAGRRLAKLSGKQTCTACGRSCSDEDSFCAACGARLPVPEDVPDGAARMDDDAGA